MEENKKMAGKDDLIQGIRLVCASDTKKTTVGRIRDIYDEIETLRMSGSSLATIHEGIVKGGFDLSLNALTVALHRIKKERKAQAVIPVLVGGNYMADIVNDKKSPNKKGGTKKKGGKEVETPVVETPVTKKEADAIATAVAKKYMAGSESDALNSLLNSNKGKVK